MHEDLLDYMVFVSCWFRESNCENRLKARICGELPLEIRELILPLLPNTCG